MFLCYSITLYLLIVIHYIFIKLFGYIIVFSIYFLYWILKGRVLNIQVIILCFFMKSFFVFLLILFVSVNCIDQKLDISHFNVSRILNKKSVATTYSTSTNAPSISFSLILHIIECGSYFTCEYDSGSCIYYVMSFI